VGTIGRRRLKKGGAYRVGKTKTEAAIHPASALKDKLPKWVVYTELVRSRAPFVISNLSVNTRMVVLLFSNRCSRRKSLCET
jgi:hypothetical protein